MGSTTDQPDAEQAALEQAILEMVHRPNYRPIKPRVIARQLQVTREQLDDVKRVVKRLVRGGRLVYEANHLVRAAETIAPAPQAGAASGETVPPAAGVAPRGRDAAHRGAAVAEGNRVTGVFRRAQGGFGFVRPVGAAKDRAETPDVYIAAADTADAATGDTVLVQLHTRPARAHLGPQGRIVEILDRETHRFVGTYSERAGSAYVVVDGTLFAQPIYVGDPGAKSAQPGDKVVFEMIRFPSYVRDGEGVITEVLGPQGKPGVDTLSIVREFDLPDEFADDALEEARQEADRFEESAIDGRLDLSGETIVTIDPVDARDFDDAISLAQLDNGHWRLGVHIADVSHFVRPKTALDRESRERATSVYLPDRVIPMLPEIISNGLASLQPGKIRYTKTVFLELTPDGLPVDTQFHNSAIRSTKRLTYEQVDEFLAQPEAWRRKLGAKVHDLLGRMYALAMILRRRRFQRGALELALREVKVDLDPDGRVAGAHVVENTTSHQMIEEFMLAANEAVAVMLHDRGLRFLRRVHQSPSERKLKALNEFVAALGFRVDGLESRFALQKLLTEVVGRPEQHAVNYAVLRSMQRAVYSPAEEGHYALASDCYCHFTSPIRRYPDLTVHRLFDALVTGRKPHGDVAHLVALGQHCSDQEQRAEMAERELTKLKLLAYLTGRIGESMDAIITGVESFGLFAQGIELPAEGLVPAASLPDDYYDFDRTAHTLTGRRAGNAYRLGDRIRVTVARVDIERRELDFRLVGRLDTTGVAPARGSGPGRSARTTQGKHRPKKKTPPRHKTKRPGKRKR